MPINAHFIQAAKLLTPGASYQANLVLPHVHEIADICRRVTVSGLGDAFVTWEGRDARGDTLKFSTQARIPAPSSPDSERPSPAPSVIDSAVVVALLVDEVVAEFGPESTAAAAWACQERGELARVGALLPVLVAEARDVKIALRTPDARFRLRADGSMAIGLQISR